MLSLNCYICTVRSRRSAMRSRLPILMASHRPPLTQSQLGEKLNIPQKTISRYYRGNLQRIDVGISDALCRFFDCTYADLYEAE